MTCVFILFIKTWDFKLQWGSHHDFYTILKIEAGLHIYVVVASKQAHDVIHFITINSIFWFCKGSRRDKLTIVLATGVIVGIINIRGRASFY